MLHRRCSARACRSKTLLKLTPWLACSIMLLGWISGSLPCLRWCHRGLVVSSATWDAPLIDSSAGTVYARCVPSTNLKSRNIPAEPRLAIVVPYPPKQASDVLEALHQWLSRAAECPEVPTPVDLFLLCSRDQASCLTMHMVETVLSVYRNESIPPELVFSAVHLRFANLSAQADAYYFSFWRNRHISPGTANLFYPLFAQAGKLSSSENSANVGYHPLGLAQDYDYFVWLEPDVYALLPCFLQMLHRHVAVHHPFWIMGSAPMYQRRHGWVVWPHDHHINGNAIYRLGDDCFTNGMIRQVAAAFPTEPFDSALQRWRMGVARDAWWRTYAHLFVYTDWIRNYGDRVWCPALVRASSPNTAMVHGRRRYAIKEEDCCTTIAGSNMHCHTSSSSTWPRASCFTHEEL
ncbi:hypothetical protein F1559_000577 [Cyanidiococcus yangmingshanensis]|uniref:Uncharacterized protein n=1 Tax=Cyanidiococcus yangmingshanensis TaxID=2690220 RepID=A0A7J7IHS3_9RHOD|nr:hypothetical protein F1559_000577 [Cyanidiococcus yangmingshanensis]